MLLNDSLTQKKKKICSIDSCSFTFFVRLVTLLAYSFSLCVVHHLYQLGRKVQLCLLSLAEMASVNIGSVTREIDWSSVDSIAAMRKINMLFSAYDLLSAAPASWENFAAEDIYICSPSHAISCT